MLLFSHQLLTAYIAVLVLVNAAPGGFFDNILNSLSSPCMTTCLKQLPNVISNVASSGSISSGICSDMGAIKACNQTCANSTLFDLLVTECASVNAQNVPAVTQVVIPGGVPAGPFNSAAMTSTTLLSALFTLFYLL
ncbi:hypothetical protein BCR33DRAFT_720504 [Rhizoclosmatium globosum]|uniref:Extracellular membrane protein CFEM domain-containing protein n=1 Tax=Rhizoclosmatium globosum TaxID=329046 RepID=A0A1Y2BW08_9FUNG|nr:hypothetical protein BCR33DRAFT_720504 [Rhizoclosmatium globosum]|eukprot:ORY38837.1 hypothetical protein BCR33DRAFT_720504 [Rhizoclosmatium globosum]